GATTASEANSADLTLSSASVRDDSAPSRTAQAAQPRLVEAYGKLPLSFEVNRGQTDARVKFLSRGSGYSLFLTGNEAVLALKKSQVRSQKSVAAPFRAAPQGSADLFSKSAVLPGVLLPTTEQFKESVALRDDAPTPSPESRRPAVLRMKLVGAN